MIPKLTTGNGFGGCLRYDTRQGMKMKSGLAKVLDVSGVEFRIDKEGNYIIDTKRVSRDFRAQTMGYKGDRDIRKPVYHWVLSYHPDDNVSEEQMIEDAKEFLRRIGFDDTQYVITVHYDKEHHHLHIVTNIVNNQGERIPTMGLIDRAHEAAAAITRERGYVWGKKAQTQAVTKEKVHDPHDRARKVIEPIIQEAKAEATSLDEFQKILESKGVACKIASAQDGKRGGISYAYEYEGVVHSFKGSSVGRELSFGYVKKALDNNLKLHEQAEADRQDAIRAQTLRKAWFVSIAPQYSKAVSVYNELYTKHTNIWDAVASDNRELSYKLTQVQEGGFKAYFEQLQENIRNAKSSSAVLGKAARAIWSLNPLMVIAVKVIEQIIIDANKETNIERRRSVREEMAGLFDVLSTIKNLQEELKDCIVLRGLRWEKAEKDAFNEAYIAAQKHQSVPVIAKKFDNISRFFPEAYDIKEGIIKKSNAGYDLFFVQVDGQQHVAADIDGKVVVSKESIEGPFYLSSLHWRDDAGKEFIFYDGTLQAEITEQDLVAALGGTSEIEQALTNHKSKILSVGDCRSVSEALHQRTMQEARIELGIRGFNVFAVERKGGISDLRIIKNGEVFHANENFSAQELSSLLENFARLSGKKTTATLEREAILKAQQEERARRAAKERQNNMYFSQDDTNGYNMKL